MSKKDVLSKLQVTRKKLVILLFSVPENRWNEVFLGKWSLRDVVAHLIGWDIENAKSVNEVLSGQLPSCFKNWDDNWASYNDLLVDRYKKGEKKELLSELDRVHGIYMKVFDNISEEIFSKDIGLRWQNYIITPSVNAEYEAQDEELHTKQIQDWLMH